MREGQLVPSVDLGQLAKAGRAALDDSDPVRAALARVRAEAESNPDPDHERPSPDTDERQP